MKNPTRERNKVIRTLQAIVETSAAAIMQRAPGNASYLIPASQEILIKIEEGKEIIIGSPPGIAYVTLDDESNLRELYFCPEYPEADKLKRAMGLNNSDRIDREGQIIRLEDFEKIPKKKHPDNDVHPEIRTYRAQE